MAKNKNFPTQKISRISVTAKNEEQKNLLRAISKNTITFVKGVAGTGKTYLAVGYGLQCLLKEQFQQLVFTRPVVEAGGEKLGFLPGNMYDKIDPYMIPIFETLSKILPPEKLKYLMPKNNNGNGNGNGNGSGISPIRVLPIAYMRGISFSDSFIICDESQNITPEQMRMILTRIGENSKMILCGDIDQTDINNSNGLQDAFELLQDIEGIGFVTLTQDAVVRHPIIRKIEERYRSRNKK